MRNIILTLLYVIFIPLASCQDKKDDIMGEPTEKTSDYIVYDNKPKTGYYLQINNQNCDYRILVNDMLNAYYNDVYPMYSTRTMLNYEILKSGKQTLKVVVLPKVGDTILSKKASIDIRLIKYSNMDDKQNNFGGSVDLMSWSLPNLDSLSEVPFYEYDFSFEAEVPYEMNTIDDAIDLKEIDEDILTKEVVRVFELLHGYIKNDYDQFNTYARGSILSAVTPTYKSRENLEQVLQNNKNTLIKKGYDKALKPLEGYKLVLYSNGRIATLERLKDNGRVIWCEDPKTRREVLSLPLFIYKDKHDSKWYIW